MISLGTAGELLNFTTTIVNNTESELSVHQGCASVDGHVALPLSVVLTNKGLSKRERKQVWELARMYCFWSGFLTSQNFFSANASSRVFTVSPKTALTVSFITKDPRNYSVRCSVEGCYPTGTIRFSVTVNTTDFVFIWPGRHRLLRSVRGNTQALISDTCKSSCLRSVALPQCYLFVWTCPIGNVRGTLGMTFRCQAAQLD